MSAWKSRVLIEREDLRAKVRSLQEFVNGDEAKRLDNEDFTTLMAQLGAMLLYLKCLDKRVGRFQ